MRVGISLLTLVPGQMGGTETYVRGLTRALAEVGTLDYAVFSPPAGRGAAGGLPEVVVDEYRTVRTRRDRILALALAAARGRRLARRFAGLDVVHHPLTVAVPRLDVPRVVTLFDLQHLDLPHLFSRAERAYRRVAYDASARTADAVVVTSQFVRRGVVAQLGVPPERVHAIPLGLDHARFRPGEEEREPFLLYPARPWPHKNHERLYDAFERLRRERPELRLVLTGGGHEARRVPSGVEVRGLVSAEELVSLYRRAACLVFPSLYEGFGQPPLEAMACGCPVAASDIPAIAEACGDAAALFDPADAEEIAAVVAGVLDAPERFSAAGVERARAFTWHETARRHEAVYEAAYGAIV
jgi:glycosyltransferase involved in cell wall biosynthesis